MLCILIHSDSQKYLPFAKQVQGVSVLGTSLRSEHSSPGVHSPWPHCRFLSPSSWDIGTTLSQQLVSSPPRPSGTTLLPIRATKDAQDGRLQSKCLQPTGHSFSRCSTTYGSGRSSSLRFQGSGDSSTAHNLSSQPVLSFFLCLTNQFTPHC